MITARVKQRIEGSSDLSKNINISRYGRDWTGYSRTVFQGIARRINQEVSQRVVQNPELVSDFLLIGQDELDSLFFKHKLDSLDEFMEFLKNHAAYRPFNWISGKTLQSYWNGGNPKVKKYNVLLAYLDIPVNEWEDWRREESESISEKHEERNNIPLLKRHFLGCYYRYYQKTDDQPVMIKTPVIFRADSGGVLVEAKTIGHQYRSTYVALRDGALYIDCENIEWNERENFIFNIGFEPNPEVIVGVSTTLDKRRRAIAIKNVLVKQEKPFDFSTTNGIEIPFDTEFPETCEEQVILNILKREATNGIHTDFHYSLAELASLA